METKSIQPKAITTKAVISNDQLLEQWQGHRRLTRKVIEAFPEDKLFTYSIGGMRTFSELTSELLVMGAPSIKGLLADKWPSFQEVEAEYKKATTKEELLKIWDKSTEEINALWPKIPVSRFQENELFWGQYEGLVYTSILYLIDNEIHHRGQGYVYLRSLGIEPPAFWDRN